MPRELTFLQWFYNLQIWRKQVVALFTSEVLSVFGLVAISSAFVVTGTRSIMTSQAKSELAVTEINYNIKIDQMGFGFRGQSENTAIIAAAKDYVETSAINEALRQRVRQILQNEIKAREIEYATLVGTDFKIIVNANTDRTGETFNPNNLVEEVLKTGEQIKTSEIVSWEELAQESPPFPPDFKQQDALIRYTVTPVFNPQTKAIVGVLVSGDIVNGKLPIIQKTLEVLNEGYNAIYLRQPTGEFSLVAAGQNMGNSEPNQPLNSIDLPNTDLLQTAVKNSDQIATGRKSVGNQTYTLAAQALLNYAGEPVAILVRGTPEQSINRLLGQSFSLQGILLIFALTVDVGLAILMGRTIVKPLKHLQETSKALSSGNLNKRVEVHSTDEVGQLAQTFNVMAEQLTLRDQTIQNQMQQLQSTIDELQQTQTQLKQEITERKQAQASLQHRTNQLRDQNTVLNQLAQHQALRQGDVATFVRVITEATALTLQVSRVSVWLYNSDRTGIECIDMFEQSSQQHHDAELLKVVDYPDYFKVLNTQELIIVDQAYSDERIKDFFESCLKPQGVFSLLDSPMRIAGETVGVFRVEQMNTVRSWEPEDENFLHSIADLVSLAVEIRDRLRVEQALNQSLRLIFQEK